MAIALAPQHRLYAAFAIYALALGSMFPRMPEIKAAMGVNDAQLGLALIGTPAGSLVALMFATPMLEHFGYRRSLRVVVPLVAVFFAIAIWASTPLQFFVALVPAGLMLGCTEIIINVEADRTEAVVGHRIMNRAHSFWSFGFFGAGVIGASMAALGVSPQLHLMIIVAVTIVASHLFLRGFAPAPARIASEGVSGRFALPSWPILVLVAVTLPAMLMEGAGIDWSAIYMDTVYDSPAFVAGIAVAVVAVSQGLARFWADRFVERFSPAGVGRVLLATLGLGIVVVVLAAGPGLSLLGFALIGVGSSVLFPLAMSAAAQRTDRPAAMNVAALAQMSFVTFLLGPPLLGLVAESFGIRWAFGLGLPLVVLGLLTVDALGRKSEPAVVRSSA